MQISIFLWSCVLEKWSCISLRMTTIDMLPIYVDDHSRIILHYIYRFKDHHTGCFLCINKRTYDTDVADLRFIDKKIQTETSNKQKKNPLHWVLCSLEQSLSHRWAQRFLATMQNTMLSESTEYQSNTTRWWFWVCFAARCWLSQPWTPLSTKTF